MARLHWIRKLSNSSSAPDRILPLMRALAACWNKRASFVSRQRIPFESGIRVEVRARSARSSSRYSPARRWLSPKRAESFPAPAQYILIYRSIQADLIVMRQLDERLQAAIMLSVGCHRRLVRLRVVSVCESQPWDRASPQSQSEHGAPRQQAGGRRLAR